MRDDEGVKVFQTCVKPNICHNLFAERNFQRGLCCFQAMEARLALLLSPCLPRLVQGLFDDKVLHCVHYLAKFAYFSFN